MNKTLTFLTAPVTALFYPRVYRDGIQSSAGRGVLYSLYVAALSVILIMMVLSAKVMPQADAFIDWAKTHMPAMVWTPEGLSLENGQTTATLTHPQFGTIAVFNMTQTTATPADVEKTYILVTARKIFIKHAPGQIEERDITGAGMRSRQQLPSKIRINGDIMAKLYQNIKSVMAFVIPFVLWMSLFIFILAANLFYSLAGLLFNVFRQNKLGYGAIFNLACFSTTAAFTPTWAILLLVPRLFPVWTGLLINLAYMFFVFKITDKNAQAA